MKQKIGASVLSSCSNARFTLVLVLASLLHGATPLHAADPTLAWTAQELNGIGNFLAVDSRGCTYVLGRMDHKDILTVKYSPSGRQLWSAVISGPHMSVSEVWDLSISELGDVYVTAWISPFPQETVESFTVRYDSTLVEQWTVSHDPFAAVDAATDLDGNLYVSHYGFGVAKYSRDGIQRWIVQQGPEDRFNEARSMDVDPAGNVYVTGSANNGGDIQDIGTVKYDTDGALQWNRRFDGASNGFDEGKDVRVDAAGYVHVCGVSYGDASSDFVVIKYAPEGDEVWVRTRDWLLGSDSPSAIEIDSHSNVYVTGYSTSLAGDMDYATIKYDSGGTLEWTRTYDAEGGNDVAVDLVVDPLENVYVTGRTNWFTWFGDYATVSYDVAGNERWAVLYDMNDGSDAAMDIGRASNGDIVVTGSAGARQGGAPSSITTIKYVEASTTAVTAQTSQVATWASAFPNPFEDGTIIRYRTTSSGHVSLIVFDSSGRILDTLVDGWREAGEFEATWASSRFPSGVYHYRLSCGGEVATGKLIRR